MKRIIGGAIAALMLTVVANAPAQANMAGLSQSKHLGVTQDGIVQKTRRRWRGRAIAGGIALGILGAAAIAASRRGYADEHYYDRRDSWRYRCNRWHRWCNQGDDRACWKLERHC